MANLEENNEANAAPMLLNSAQKLHVRVTVHQILKVDLHEETFSMEFDVFFRWQDPRLRDWPTRLWLPEDSPVKGARRCEGQCICKKRGRCSGLLYVEGVFRESKEGNKIKVKGLDEQTVPGFIFKEEPDFDDFGHLFGEKSSVVSFAKLMEEPSVLTEFTRLTDGHKGEIVLFRKMRALFKENMELKRFPFDRQLLQFTITSAVDDKILDLEPESEQVNCRVKELSEYIVDQQEQKAANTLSYKKTQGPKRYAQLKVEVCIQRKPGKYLINIILMIYLLVLASFGCFLIDINSPGDRISIIITFVLTIMALKYVINDQLPGKDYQTWLDVYLLSSYVFLIAPAVELLVLKAVTPDPEFSADVSSAVSIDTAFACFLFGLWNVLHLILSVVYTCRSSWLYLDWDQVRQHQDDKAEDHTCWHFEEMECPFLCAASDSESSQD